MGCGNRSFPPRTIGMNYGSTQGSKTGSYRFDCKVHDDGVNSDKTLHMLKRDSHKLLSDPSSSPV